MDRMLLNWYGKRKKSITPENPSKTKKKKNCTETDSNPVYITAADFETEATDIIEREIFNYCVADTELESCV